jgi:hypothetical protein
LTILQFKPKLLIINYSQEELSMNGVYNAVRGAIQNKQIVVADYRGYRREMCPHVIGLKNGRQQCLFFQFAGGSSSGLPPGGEWRCIPIEGLGNVMVKDGQWHTGAAHTRPQTCVDVVDVEAQF